MRAAAPLRFEDPRGWSGSRAVPFVDASSSGGGSYVLAPSVRTNPGLWHIEGLAALFSRNAANARRRDAHWPFSVVEPTTALVNVSEEKFECRF